MMLDPDKTYEQEPEDRRTWLQFVVSFLIAALPVAVSIDLKRQEQEAEEERDELLERMVEEFGDESKEWRIGEIWVDTVTGRVFVLEQVRPNMWKEISQEQAQQVLNGGI